MFGLPGETEDDFNDTLKILERNKKYITALNPSPSFCGIAPGTYLCDHPEEFMISTPINNGHFWRSIDNSNNYLIRLSRFERFCRFASSLGINSLYPKNELINRYRTIGDYYFHIRDYSKALEYYGIFLEKEGEDKKILQQIENCLQTLKQNLPIDAN